MNITPQSQPKALQFLFVGRLLNDKGIVEFVAAATEISKHYPLTTFRVVGGLDTQNPAAITTQQLKHWQATNVIDYCGKVADIRPYIAAADVIVLPSYREGLPRVMLEGMSMAKPLITTNVAGCRETVMDGKNGFLVQVKDSTDLADAMVKMILLPEVDRKNMGWKGRQMAIEKFEETKIIQTYEKHILKCWMEKQQSKKTAFLPTISDWQKKPFIAKMMRNFTLFCLLYFFLFPSGISQVQTTNWSSNLSLLGYSGNIFTPSANISPDKTLNIGMSHLPYPNTFQPYGDGSKKGARMTFANLVFLPFMELSIGFNKPYSPADETDIGLGDREIFLRFQLLKEQKNIPAILIGLHDMDRGNAFANTNYLVLSKTFVLPKELQLFLNGGYGFKIQTAQGHYLLGAFGSAGLRWKFLETTVEYDTQQINLALKANIKNRVFLQAALLDLAYFSGSIHVRFGL